MADKTDPGFTDRRGSRILLQDRNTQIKTFYYIQLLIFFTQPIQLPHQGTDKKQVLLQARLDCIPPRSFG